MEKVTFVISTYEDIQTTIDTINSLLATTQGHEKDIIVVDDANTILHELDIFPEVKVYRNEIRCGVGYSLDKGVRLAETEIVLFLGNDIRFKGDWLPRFYNVVKDNSKSLVSTVTAGLSHEQGRLQLTGKENLFYGSHFLFQVTTQNNNRVLQFREYLELKWNGKIEGDVEPIQHILGAFYGAHKSWYEKIGGFEGHLVWGNLESLISFRSYLNGGNCIIDTKTITGHIFRSSSSHKPIYALIYNKLLIAYTILPSDLEEKVYAWAKSVKHSEMAFIHLEREKEKLEPYRKLKESFTDEQLREILKPSGLFD